MTPEENKAIMRRFVDEYQTEGRVATADELLADDFIDHNPGPGVVPGKEGVKQFFTALRGGLPDLHVVIHIQVAEGDRVVTRKTFYGTHRGDLMGIPPTGKQVAFIVTDVVRMRDGQIAEHWNVVDLTTLLQQVGAIPAQPSQA